MDKRERVASGQLSVASQGPRTHWRSASSNKPQLTTDNWQLTTDNWKPATNKRQLRPKGFSFTEILFAVMILGIGFIMVAAMFPVGIQQTQANNQETVTAAVARASSEYLNRVAAAQVNLGMPASMNYVGPANPVMTSPLAPTFTQFPNGATLTMPNFASSITIPGQVWSLGIVDNKGNAVVPFVDGHQRDSYVVVNASGNNLPHLYYLWNSVLGNLVPTADPRYAWIPLYKRDIVIQGTPGAAGTTISWAPYAQVIMIGIQAGGESAFKTYQFQPNSATDRTDYQNPWVFQPELMKVSITPGINGNPTMATFKTGNINRIAEGSYLIVSDTQFDGAFPPNAQQLALDARIFRVGVEHNPPSPNHNQWDLRPGDDLTPSDLAALGSTNPFLCDAYVIGRGIAPYPTYKGSGPIPFRGPSQEVAVYTTFVQVPN